MSRHDVTSASTNAAGADTDLIEVWGDRVRLRDLVIAIFITAACIIATCVIANLLGQDILFWGMGGSVAGFIVSSLVVSTKRDVVITSEELPVDVASPADAELPAGAKLRGDVDSRDNDDSTVEQSETSTRPVQPLDPSRSSDTETDR